MARFTGPKGKIVRRFGANIFGNSKFDKLLKKKPYGPGEHGQARKKQSEYAVQLMEKQKVKLMYGVLERQFRRYYKKASKAKGITGHNLMIVLESRLDNTVYRLGFANTRDFARQLVRHRHILVNGKIVDIPSYGCKPGDVISVKEKSKKIVGIHESLRNTSDKHMVPWLELDKANLSGVFKEYPHREDIPAEVNETLIVELYSK
jgi:small subunit ribosomal protein S4